MDKVSVKEGGSGAWKVSTFTISKLDARMSVFSYGCRAPKAGIYTKLTCNGETIMSDTDAEMIDHVKAVRVSKGHILINGLGLGMVLLNCMNKPEVTKATIIEMSPDVIALVGPHYKSMYGDRINIIQANALEHKPPKGERYGMVWHDIWPTISCDNWNDMKTLHRRYGRCSDWQGSWAREQVRELMKEQAEDDRYREMFKHPKIAVGEI
jgi:hypothetical protein